MTPTPTPERAPPAISPVPKNAARADDVRFASAEGVETRRHPAGTAPDVVARLEALYADAQAARAEAERANLAKTEFLATISHELRTPLTSIRGFTELLLDEIAGSLNETQRDQLTRIDVASEHLVGLVDDVLQFSRLAAGGESVHVSIAIVDDVCRAAIMLVRPVAEKKGLRLDYTIDDAASVFASDDGKIRQILVNLLANAVKFTAEGHVSLHAAVEGGTLVAHVADTGPGIPAEFLEQIFEPFRQVDQSLTRRVGGTGLGLSIARTLARLLGGDVTVASQPASGSTFSIRIPASPVASAH